MIPLQTRANLVTLYGEPHRYYHNLQHIFQCLNEFHDLLTSSHGLAYDDIAAIEWAIWFHDCVYNPRAVAPMNEVDSATLALETMHTLRVKDVVCEKTRDMIIATGEHTQQKLYPIQTQYFLDIDLSVLGGTPREYSGYSQNIRHEYASFVERDKYNMGRTLILQGILNRPNIYYTDFFQKKYEAQARKNIQWEINELSSHV